MLLCKKFCLLIPSFSGSLFYVKKILDDEDNLLLGYLIAELRVTTLTRFDVKSR